MARAMRFPTYEINALGLTKTIPLNKANVRVLAQRSRQYGHFNKGHDPVANADLVEVICPLCRDRVQGFTWRRWPSRPGRTPSAAIDAAMAEHLIEDCRRVTRP